MEYFDRSDNDLVALANGGDTQAIKVIIERYKDIVKSIARSMFLVGGEVDDLIQEGTLGVLKAITTYNGKSAFKSYVFLCVKSNIISAIRKSNSKKNLPLNNYISLTGFEDDSSDKNSMMLSMANNPEDDYINNESVEELKNSIKRALSNYEFKVLSLYLTGSSLEVISKEVDKDQKSVENALHRIRKKIQTNINN